jgi:hypothetical protein
MLLHHKKTAAKGKIPAAGPKASKLPVIRKPAAKKKAAVKKPTTRAPRVIKPPKAPTGKVTGRATAGKGKGNAQVVKPSAEVMARLKGYTAVPSTRQANPTSSGSRTTMLGSTKLK